jgi:ATP-dependent Lhr-like helicase
VADIYSNFLERYGNLTLVQNVARPIIEKGDNCIIVAPTGSGKTEAALLPAIKRLHDESAELRGIRIIYITPLRALNRDLMKRLAWLCDKAGISISVRHGDTTQSERKQQEKNAPVLLITTPETLQSILPSKAFSSHLKNVSFVIVDEIHELYFNKRGAQLSVGLERLEELSRGFVRIGISATVSKPEEIGRFLCGGRKFHIAASETKKMTDIKVHLPKIPSGLISKEMISDFALDDPSTARLEDIIKTIKDSKSTLIFGNTRQVVEALGSRLIAINRVEGFGGIGVHHGSLDKKDRIEVEDLFKTGRIKSLISTSSLELGIDIGDIDHVIQYGSPRQAVRLAQRVGRSGHSEKRTSKGLIISSSRIDALEALSTIKCMEDGKLEEFATIKGPLDVLCNQICGIALDKREVEIDYVKGIIRSSYCFSDQKDEEFESLLLFMKKQHLVSVDGTKIFASGSTRMYYYSHLSFIPDSKKVLVKNVSDNRMISSLDERFVAANLEEGTVFIAKGLPWKIVSIDDESISVEPSESLDGAIPDWVGEDIPVSWRVADTTLNYILDPSKIPFEKMNQVTLNAVTDFCSEQGKAWSEIAGKVVIERLDDKVILHSGLGTMANEGLSKILSKLILSFTGKGVTVRSSPYMIMFEGTSDIKLDYLMSRIPSHRVNSMLEDAIKESDMFRYNFIYVAKFFGVIDRKATVSKSMSKRLMRVLSDTPVYRETIRHLMNLLDIEVLKTFIQRIEEGTLRLVEVNNPDISPLAQEVLNSAYYTMELVMPIAPSKAIIDSFSSFIMNKKTELLCTYCGFYFGRSVKELWGQCSIHCPSCNSVMICRYSEERLNAVKKRIAGKRFNAQEKKIFAEAMADAGLLSSHGGKAIAALNTYGVGASGAARILLMQRVDDSLFYRDLIEAQKRFIRTKKYWRV